MLGGGYLSADVQLHPASSPSETYPDDSWSTDHAQDSIQSYQSFTSGWEYLLLNDQLRTMVQPEAIASSSVLSTHKRKTTPRQDKRQRWRKNYMMMSSPCNKQAGKDKTIRFLERANYPTVTQSMYSHPGSAKSEHCKKRLLRILRKCAESMEEMASVSYVDSMRSCSSDLKSDDSEMDDLIDLSDRLAVQNPRYVPRTPSHIYHDTAWAGSDQLGGTSLPSEYFHDIRLDSQAVFLTPKLKLADSFSSSYVTNSDASYSGTQCQLAVKGTAKKSQPRRNSWSTNDPEDYYGIISNGKTTAFLSEDEVDSNELSFYYDDEFEFEDDVLGHGLRDSDLEAAICNEYASLLDNAAGNLLPQSAVSDAYQSNLSSDLENIFRPSLSLLDNDSSGDVCSSFSLEENEALDSSVPNYSKISRAAPKDYQLTFARTGSVYSDARSVCVSDSDSDTETASPSRPSHHKAHILKTNQVPKPPRARASSVQLSTKKVSFSDELATIAHDDDERPSAEERMQEVGSSTTWLEMKRNYTTWGQVKLNKDDPHKSKSVPDITKAHRRQESPSPAVKDEEQERQKRYSLTLWEQYKRAHSMSLSASLSELKTPDAFTQPTRRDQMLKDAQIQQDINDLIDDALKPAKESGKSDGSKMAAALQLPDLTFLRESKSRLMEANWWSQIFDQPSFCTTDSSAKTCSQCERKHSADHQVIMFQGSQMKQQKVCQVSVLEQLLSPGSHCQCIRQKLCDLSSGIATGSSGVTPREPNSWQHIADFLKRRQRTSDGSRGSLNTTLSDQQLLDVVACIDAADSLAKTLLQSSNSGHVANEVLLKVWKLVSSLECVLGLGLKSHKLVTVAMGKIRTRVSFWDIVEESSASNGAVTDTFAQVLMQVSRCKPEDSSMRFCLFIVGLLNAQCLDFWWQTLLHNRQLLDKYYHDDSFLRSKVVHDRKLHSEILQSLQPLSLPSWDINFQSVMAACTRSTEQGSSDQSNLRQSPVASPTRNKVLPTGVLPSGGLTAVHH